MSEKQRKILVIGHKNPDTDSICSAIAYASLKNKINNTDIYVPMRAGDINAETRFVLERFEVDEPAFIEDVGTQVRDIDYREVEGVQGIISLKKAYTLMKETNAVTLPITNAGFLEGLITIGDIATSYMDVYDSRILSAARTPYKNIIETLDATLVVGDEDAVYEKGKVLVAAANPDLMENYIEENDLVILGNRYESQLCAIEMNAACIVVCEGAPVSMTIKKLAQEKNCTVISTPHDTYTVARLINQSMPVEHFMIKDKILTFRTDDFIEEIKDVMAKNRNRDFPILDHKGRFKGMISRRNLLDMKKKKIILVDHNEKNQAVDGIEDSEILEIIDHHRLGTIETISPVYFRNHPLGCTATIVYQMYNEAGIAIEPKIAGLLCSAILSDTLMYRSPTCTAIDRQAAEELAKIAEIDAEEYADQMFRAGSDLSQKTADEIFYQDFKRFVANNVSVGIGQINGLDSMELENIKEKLVPYINEKVSFEDTKLVFFMITDIIKQSTELLYAGDGAEELIENAFNKRGINGSIVLDGVVSRKKQLVPALIEALQQ